MAHRKHLTLAILTALLLIAGARVIATYKIFNHTIDEPTHISCGLEWWQTHKYTYEYQHPPLSRVLAAIGPWLLNTRNIPRKEDVPSKNPLVLYDSPNYYATLATARAGELPFLFLAAIVVFCWTRSLHGDIAALLSTALLLTLPPVLAHSGLATTDASLMATLPWSLYALSRLLAAPSPAAALHFGTAAAFGILSKFSFFLFFPACAAVVLAQALFRDGRRAIPRPALLLLAAATAFAITWSGYLWSSHPFPLAGIYLGLVEVREHNLAGHLTYLLGETGTNGWWYFFPVVFFYKTPLAFLLLCLGTPWLFKKQSTEAMVPLGCAVMLMLAVLPSRINLGVRHLLPIYPLLAISAGAVLQRCLTTNRIALRTAAALLAVWQIGVSTAAHPDYLAYFNEAAGSDPEEIRVDSDLDWGQNFDRLSRYLRQRGITEPIGLRLFGPVDPSRHGLNWYPVSPWQPVQGWVAISATEKMLPSDAPPPGVFSRPWRWLERHEPVARIGGSVLLYKIPPTPVLQGKKCSEPWSWPPETPLPPPKSFSAAKPLAPSTSAFSSSSPITATLDPALNELSEFLSKVHFHKESPSSSA